MVEFRSLVGMVLEPPVAVLRDEPSPVAVRRTRYSEASCSPVAAASSALVLGPPAKRSGMSCSVIVSAICVTSTPNNI